jgi:drug/metabolite transporter (DMT)-like permease
LSWRLWLASFVGTAGVYLAQTGAERAALHSSALPVFAVLAVLVAALYRTAERFLGDYERIAARAEELLRTVGARREPLAWPRSLVVSPPRRLFGLAFESRPPPAPT